MNKATFGAGCFWGVEHAFRQVTGVSDTTVGYAGGSTESPSYEQVCTGSTGHAEVVQIEFDLRQVTYEQLLDVFWECHDPTTLNRQGPDHGSQYRSVIFCHSAEQTVVAESSKQRLRQRGRHSGDIVTSIEPAATFYRAEEYHQRYLEKRGQASCRLS